jgi:hypothetical protein
MDDYPSRTEAVEIVGAAGVKPLNAANRYL